MFHLQSGRACPLCTALTDIKPFKIVHEINRPAGASFP